MTKSAPHGPAGYRAPVSDSPPASKAPVPVRPAAAGLLRPGRATFHGMSG